MAIQLPAPIISDVTLKRGVYSGYYYSEIDFSWSRDSNATGIEYSFNNLGPFTSTAQTGVIRRKDFKTGTNVFRIRATGDGTNYTDSDWTERTVEAVADEDYYNFRFELSPDETRQGRFIFKEVLGADTLASGDRYHFNVNPGGVFYNRDVPIYQVPTSWSGERTVVGLVDSSNGLGGKTVVFPVSTIALYAPETLSTSNVTRNTATLNWSSVREATGYLIKYRRASDTAWTQTSTTATTLALTGLTPGTVYNWTATALGNGNNYLDSIETDEVTFETQAAPKLSTPTGLTADQITSTGARIGWNAVANATGYIVEYKPHDSSTWIEG